MICIFFLFLGMKMNSEKDLGCPNCLISFDNKADLSSHLCVQIKTEANDLKDQKQTYGSDVDLDNLDKSMLDQKEDLIHDDSFLELSEEFIFTILRQVDDLCENIQNGDPDLKRTLEVNQNLNNAVGCYRAKLLELKALDDSEYLIDGKVLKTEDPLTDFDNIDSEYVPLKKKKKNKIKAGGIKNDENLGKTRKRKRNTGQPVGRPKKEKHGNTFSDVELFSYVGVDDTIKIGEPGRLYCRFCNQFHAWRTSLFVHLNTMHYSEIKEDKSTNQNSDQTEEKKDCGGSERKMCKNLYGSKRLELWCLKCNDIRIQQSKKPWVPPPDYVKKRKILEFKVCIECGKSVKNMTSHVQFSHKKERQICVHCGKEKQSLHSMARANLNKSKKVSTFNTTASKYIPKRPRICIN